MNWVQEYGKEANVVILRRYSVGRTEDNHESRIWVLRSGISILATKYKKKKCTALKCFVAECREQIQSEDISI
jgi:hypothetical protein